MATTSVSKMDASVWGMLLAEVRLLPTMSIERIESLPCEGCIKPVNPFIVAVVIRANELPRAEAARLVLQGCGRARSAVRAEFEKGVQMSPFDHYMYVLACGDGSLYTGYATDVQARLAAHQSGRGAKYTKSHAPVSLVAQARFYSKARAMSAEAHFKQLSREQKDKLLERSKLEPLEDVLRRELPGFGEDTAAEFVCRSLANHVDPNYAAFMRPLVPTVDPRRLVGVRTPQLRKIARELYRRGDASDFMRSLPHVLFEESQVHALAIGMEREYERAIELYDLFLPHVDNWATCDQLPVRVLAEQPARTLECARRWMSSEHGFTVRFGIGVLMRLFLDDLFEPRFAAMVAAARMPGSPERPEPESDAYYVDMMRAWYFAEALVRQPMAAWPYAERRDECALLDEWTRRKAIQKACESRRISVEAKERLRSFR